MTEDKLNNLQAFIEDIYSRLEKPSDREYWTFTEIWQKIENYKSTLVCIKKCCMICKYLQVNEIYSRNLTNKGHYTCGADNPVYGSVKLYSICKLFEVTNYD